MPDIPDGEIAEVQGSARDPYILRNVGGVYSCSCPAWRNQSVPIERRTCKHLKKYRGAAAEEERIGSATTAAATAPAPRKLATTSTDDDDTADAAQDPGLLLAQSWTNDIDLTGWWMSEKLDGIRAYWDGERFFSRKGNLFHAPDWFLDGLPSTPLDGELWLARKAFQRTSGIVRRQDKSDHWKQLCYVVFDLPAATGSFEDRQALLAETFRESNPAYARPLEQEICRGELHLREELERVEALGGEGLMLRQPGSIYESGRSFTLLKVKRFHDVDAVVLEHQAGKGRHKGRMGAVVAQLPDGTTFAVGTGFKDKDRENPPPIGCTITIRYQELTDRGAPRFPSFVRVRGDEP